MEDEEFLPGFAPEDLEEGEEFMPGFAEEDLVEGEAFRPDAVSRDLGDSRGLGQHVGVNDRPHGPDFPFVGVPTISPAVFEAWLRARRSPRAGRGPGAGLLPRGDEQGDQPGVALAFFHHESQCGGDTSIIPPGTRNWGNLRPRTDGSLGRGGAQGQHQRRRLSRL